MTNEHNPIAKLVTKIQQKWLDEISPNPDLKLVRWLMKPGESKLFEGFLKLESTAYGKLPEILIALLTPFTSISTYSRDLMKNWFETFDKDKNVFESLSKNGNTFKWNDDFYREKIFATDQDPEKLLLEMLSSFYKACNMPERKLILALFPYSLSNTMQFSDWVKKIYKTGIPAQIQFCFFDLQEERYYDKLFNTLDEKSVRTLMIDLNLPGAIKKIIQSGDPNDPATRLQRYIQLMSEAVAEKNLSKLENNGNKCIEDMITSKIKSLMATAYIAYAGMLFNFKKYEQIDELLTKGQFVAEAGKKAGDTTCASLIIQFCNFKGSSFQLNKKYKEAITWFCKAAEASLQINQGLPAISAFRQASAIAKAHDKENYLNILERGYSVGENTNKEELLISDYNMLSYDYFQLLNQKGDFEKSDNVDNTMKDKFGLNWKEDVKEKLVSPNQKIHA